MTSFDIEEPLLATYYEKSQESGNRADNGDNDPAQAPIDCVLYATAERLSLTQTEGAV